MAWEPTVKREDSVSESAFGGRLLDPNATIYLNRKEGASLASELRLHRSDTAPKPKLLNMWSGVFIPTAENMWGVLIFIRFHQIIAYAGVGDTIMIVVLSVACAGFTAVSVGAICSSGGASSQGGPYIMISRSLGASAGAVVGSMYYLGIVFGTVLECLGAVETIIFAAQIEFDNSMRALGSAFVLVLTLIVLLGSVLTAKLGAVFFVIVLFTLISYFVSFGLASNSGIPGVGLDINNFAANWPSRYAEGYRFNDILAIFFSTYTGILTGADRAHQLRDPSKDIHHGTYLAISFSTVLFIAYLFLWSLVGSPAVLQQLPGVEITGSLMNWPHPIVVQIGIVVASTSQCLQCLVGGSILLRSLAADNVIPLLTKLRMHKLHKGEPLYALLFTYLLCACFVLIGNLDIVASLVSMCFLLCYASINFSTFILSALRAPNWRAAGSRVAHVRFLTNSFAGFILCVVMMFLVAWLWAVLALVISIVLFAYINYVGVQVQYGSGISGIRYQLAIDSILSLQSDQRFVVNWRPQILCFIDHSSSSEELLRVVQVLQKGRGMLMLLCVVPGHPIDPEALKQRAELQIKIPQILKKLRIDRALSKIIIAPSVGMGMMIGLQASGVGGLQPNCMLVGWPRLWKSDHTHLLRFLNLIVQGNEEDKSILVWKGLEPLPLTPTRGFVDVWWIVHDGGLMLLFAFLILRHRLWRGCKLRIFAISLPNDNSVLLQKTLKEILYKLKIEFAHLEVVELDSTAIDPFTTNLTIRAAEREQFLSAHGIHEAFPETLRNMRPAVAGPFFPDPMPESTTVNSVTIHVSGEGDNNTKSSLVSQALPLSLSGQDEPPQVEMIEPRKPLEEPKVLNHEVTPSVNEEKKISLKEADAEEETSKLLAENTRQPSLEGQELNQPDSSKDSSPGPTLRRVPPTTIRPRLNLATLRPSSTNYDELVADRSLLNTLIVARSASSEMVIINLPDPQFIERQDSPDGFIPRLAATLYMEYVEGITRGLSRILLVHGTGHEIVKDLE